MRCLALAQAWNAQQGQTVFMVGEIPKGIENRLKSEGMSSARIASGAGTEEDAEELITAARRLGAERIVLDGYHFGASYQETVKKADFKFLFMDDYGHADYYFADLILNQNLYADETMYSRRNLTTQLLLGTRYALLRSEFLSWSAWSRYIPPIARRILVTLGGSDPDNATCRVIRSLHGLGVSGLEVKILLGPANLHYEAVQQAVAQASGQFELLTPEVEMAGLMAWADLAISAAGSTCWELAFMGLPTATIVLAENQRRIAHSLAEAGITSNAGWHSHLDADQLTQIIARLVAGTDERREMSSRGRAILDGLGAWRVSQILRDAHIESC
jgi:UDP-2,4-diacetamido-2,4,6-trideoxy-beta-L-altropyranose hydrolase